MSEFASIRPTQWSALFLLGALVVGCGGTTRTGAWGSESAGADDTSAAAVEKRATLLRGAEAAWEKRDDAAEVVAAIEAWQAALQIMPSDTDTWAMLSRAQYFNADCQLRFTDKEAMKAEYNASIDSAERSLVTRSAAFAEKMKSGARIEEAIEVLDKSAVPALYWRSSALGKWASEEGFATLLSYKDEVRAVMEFCLNNDRPFFHFGPDRYFGVFYARAPGFAGGDLDKSRDHFERSIKAEPRYLGTRVLMAEDYAVKSADQKLYEELLNFVVNADANSLPEVAPENRCEQRKAKEDLEKVDELF
ncbi:MAG: TRAP transporter TatT component family protein [Polyangiales bacterium]